MLAYLITGITLGFAAGISPGPLMALLVAQTVRYGLREGLKTALAPALTDAPIVTATLLLLARISNLNSVLGGISITGGVYVIWLGIESLRIRRVEVGEAESAPHSIRKAMGVNLLNPHVYLFWGTVGAPTVLRATGISLAAAVGFIAGFYVLLCGSKMVLAVLVHRSRAFLGGRAYRRTVQGLGGVLMAFGAWLLWQGAGYFTR